MTRQTLATISKLKYNVYMNDSLVSRHQLFLTTALVGAHAQYQEVGFRHKHVRFLIELFSNWVEVGLPGDIIEIQNTQIARFLSTLIDEGFARRINKKGHPLYRLTRVGLIELLSRAGHRNYIDQKECFFFLYFFITNYRDRLIELVRREGSQFPPAMQMEVAALLDSRELVRRELAAAERELQRIDVRIHDSRKTVNLARQWLRDGKSIDSVVQEAERLWPYELNSTKPLSELIGEVPPETRAWEMTTGNEMRRKNIWEKARVLLLAYITELEGYLNTEE